MPDLSRVDGCQSQPGPLWPHVLRGVRGRMAAEKGVLSLLQVSNTFVSFDILLLVLRTPGHETKAATVIDLKFLSFFLA